MKYPYLWRQTGWLHAQADLLMIAHTVMTWGVERLGSLPLLSYASTSYLYDVPAFPCEIWLEMIFPVTLEILNRGSAVTLLYHTTPKSPLSGSVAWVISSNLLSLLLCVNLLVVQRLYRQDLWSHWQLHNMVKQWFIVLKLRQQCVTCCEYGVYETWGNIVHIANFNCNITNSII